MIGIVLNESVSAEINERGRFAFDRLALGQYRVRLDTRELGKHCRFTTKTVAQISLSEREGWLRGFRSLPASLHKDRSEVIQGYEGVLQDRVYRRGRVKGRVARARPSMNEGYQRYLKRRPPFLAAGVFTLFLLMTAFSQVTLSTVNASSDLSITKSSSPTPAISGEEITYTIKVMNSGPSDALEVVVTETYHENFVFSSSSPSPDRGSTNQWTFEVIQAGDTETISITGVVDPSTLESLSNTVSLTSDTADPDPANNTTGFNSYILSLLQAQ